MLKNRIASVLVIAAGIMTPAATMADDYDMPLLRVVVIFETEAFVVDQLIPMHSCSSCASAAED